MSTWSCAPAKEPRCRSGCSIDGEAPGPAHGIDVDATGLGTLVEPRLYQLVREPGAIADRTLEVAFAAAGVEAYVFTFG